MELELIREQGLQEVSSNTMPIGCYDLSHFKLNSSWRYEEEEDVRQRRQCAQLLGIAAETTEGTLAPIVGSMYVRAHFDSDIWLEAQESGDSVVM